VKFQFFMGFWVWGGRNFA